MTEPDPRTLDPETPTAGGDGRSGKQHGDPLLAASEGATEGTEGSRHGADAAPGADEERG